MEAERRSTGFVVVVLLFSAVLACGAIYFYGLGLYLGMCGENRPPGDSPEGQTCEWLTEDSVGKVVSGAIALTGFAGFAVAVWLGFRWLRSGRRGGWFMLAAVLAPLLPIAFLFLAASRSEDCPADKQAAYDAWADERDAYQEQVEVAFEASGGNPVAVPGDPGDAPYECYRTYRPPTLP